MCVLAMIIIVAQLMFSACATLIALYEFAYTNSPDYSYSKAVLTVSPFGILFGVIYKLGSKL